MRSITFKVNNNRQLSGDFTINLETQEVTLASFAEGNDSLYLAWTDQPLLTSGSEIRAYMTSLPTLQVGDDYCDYNQQPCSDFEAPLKGDLCTKWCGDLSVNTGKLR